MKYSSVTVALVSADVDVICFSIISANPTCHQNCTPTAAADPL
jgi:hypothetical protein